LCIYLKNRGRNKIRFDPPTPSPQSVDLYRFIIDKRLRVALHSSTNNEGLRATFLFFRFLSLHSVSFSFAFVLRKSYVS